jgi:CheY-like chemotaxis protein
VTPRSDRPLAGHRILVVDDQPSIRGVLERALSEAGADVWTMPDGPSALRAVEHALPDLILLDLVMPQMDGWAVIAALVASTRTARVPVILETSAQEFSSFDRAKRQGVAAFISKPFRLAEVIETCRRVLEGARPLQGRSTHADAVPPVQVRHPDGDMITLGRLLDLGPGGAQIETEEPLALAQAVSLVYRDGDGTVTVSGHVRWMTRVGDRYHQGLQLRKS